MAKGNLFLGTAGNSVGDVVMYRREGSQVSRVRVRKVKNPKTDAQSLQRAAFSPVAKFYSPLAIVLERSFEGLSKSKSYAKFLKTNVDLARANGWLLPKGTGFFPLPYKLTNGTLPVINYSNISNTGFDLNIAPGQNAPTTIGDLSTCFINAGYQAGDIITIILVLGSSSTGFYPVVYQFEVDSTSTATIADVLPKLTIGMVAPTDTFISFSITSGNTLNAVAVIAARYQNDIWRRSSQNLLVVSSIISEITSAEYRAAAIASYGPNAGDPNPLVYLDGDTLEG